MRKQQSTADDQKLDNPQMLGEIKGHDIEMASGTLVDPFDVRPEQVRLFDVAHGLGNLCRFGGHCAWHYSVAQHSCNVNRLMKRIDCDARTMMVGLLHDAWECYLGCDIPGPVKQRPEFRFVQLAEDRGLKRIVRALTGIKLSYQSDEWALTKHYDAVAGLLESRALMPRPRAGQDYRWGVRATLADETAVSLNRMRPEEAMGEFTERFFRLMRKLR